MAYSVSFEPESIDDLDSISQVMRVRILKKIEWLSVNFEKVSGYNLMKNLILKWMASVEHLNDAYSNILDGEINPNFLLV